MLLRKTILNEHSLSLKSVLLEIEFGKVQIDPTYFWEMTKHTHVILIWMLENEELLISHTFIALVLLLFYLILFFTCDLSG
jgi:hypothetical protein